MKKQKGEMSKYKIYAAPRIIAQELKIIPDIWLPEHIVVVSNGENMWVLNLDTGYLSRYTDPLPADYNIKGDSK